MWLDLDLDSQRAARASQPNAGVNESNKALNQVQDGLNFQLSGWLFFHTRFNLESVKCPTTRSLLQVVPPLGRYAKPPAHDSELKAAERRLSSPSSRRSAVEVYWPLSLFLPTVCLTQPLFYGALNLDEQQFSQVYSVMQKLQEEAKQKGLSKETPGPEAAEAAKQIVEQFKAETQTILTPEQSKVLAEVLTHFQLDPRQFGFNFNF